MLQYRYPRQKWYSLRHLNKGNLQKSNENYSKYCLSTPFDELLGVDLWLRPPSTPLNLAAGTFIRKAEGILLGVVLGDIAGISHPDLDTLALQKALDLKMSVAHKILSAGSTHALLSDYVRHQYGSDCIFSDLELDLLATACTTTVSDCVEITARTLGLEKLPTIQSSLDDRFLLFRVLSILLDHLLYRLHDGLRTGPTRVVPRPGPGLDTNYLNGVGLPDEVKGTFQIFLMNNYGERTAISHGTRHMLEIAPKKISYLIYIFLYVCSYARTQWQGKITHRVKWESVEHPTVMPGDLLLPVCQAAEGIVQQLSMYRLSFVSYAYSKVFSVATRAIQGGAVAPC